jgi:hypothetical protein
MDLQELLGLIPEAGATGLLVYYIVANWKGWIVPKRELDAETARRKEVERERNDWRELALQGTNLADKLANVQERRLFTEGKG